ncbi:hypothetical protein G7K_0452-t1 [Saitoella complicata NRRL Y-17804]|uniref:Uncharacterized protein n=1 Tax=Saitoella complicata (strain BCRC 22490 / CBS 7301 / JCM 7358 / NBRC 10748 / NRRL Y-17804) TaxID=698492 RepID=A0A0E9N8I9_SAICN|nr:hypothetical protein G7K_0452-t1 [Saitoella complicata NRRL Y-17804]
MTIKWDATNDQRLLLAILAVTQKVDYKAIATYFGQDVTSKAISERISKLRKQVGSSVSTSNGANGSALPKKRAAPASTKGVGKGGSPKRSKNVKDKEEEEEEEEILADADETPEAEEVKTEPTISATRPRRGSTKVNYAELIGLEVESDEELVTDDEGVGEEMGGSVKQEVEEEEYEEEDEKEDGNEFVNGGDYMADPQ